MTQDLTFRGGYASRKQGVKAPVIYTETVLLEKNLVGLAFGKNAANLEKARGLDGVITIDFDGCLSTFRIEAKAIKKQGHSKADSKQEVSDDDDFASVDEDESDEDDSASQDSTRGKLTDVLESLDKLKEDFKAQKGDMLRLQGEVDGLKKKLKKERKQRAVLEKSLGEVTTKLKDQQKTEKGQSEVEIWNSACLPAGFIVLTDNTNGVLKVYTFKGSLCHTRKSPVFSALAVLSATEVAATSDGCIEILRITDSKLSVKESFKIPKAYHALVAVSSSHLAGAYGLMLFDSGIDLLNMNGKLIRNICTGVKADCLSLTPKGELVGIQLNRIFLMDLMSDQSGGCKRQVGIPGTNLASLSVDHYGHLFIINRESQTVLCVDSSLKHSFKLWTLAESLFGAGDLCTIAVARESCVCVTKKGLVSVCQIVY
ncbi:hypothetical protein PoB_005319800 [Plakobranchus ocellatus]|uniref:Uncharacterized protein n=1 Tax=Plakobranchus ocellatus TaxID=259542 RepID=A0AAV4C452_9GAST|nr:hypothetical protein PoB_005319800 [Plakobranchus ocellatus]